MTTDTVVIAVAAATACQKKPRKARSARKNRDKSWWTDGYNTWCETEFKKRMRISRESFAFILQTITPFIQKQPTQLNPIQLQPIDNLGLLCIA